MDYAAAVQELQRRGRFGINLGLDRIEALLAELDHPGRRLRGALVGGTNGKGSVVALVTAALTAGGLRVGSMPKPHLVSYRERIAVDGVPVGEERFAAAVTRVLPAVERVAARLGEPTEFEFLTAAGILEIAEAGIDAAVIEVGLGGRLDATNALDLGVAAITNVQHDHERHLGRTLRQIGTEKAAIIKRGNRAVTGARPPGLEPIVARCAELGVPLRRVGAGQPYEAAIQDVGWDGVLLDVARPREDGGRLDSLRVGLIGRHQAANACVALAILDALRDRWADGGTAFPVDEAAIRRGFAGAKWPGRLEVAGAAALGIDRLLLDGAHNPAGTRVLRDALVDLGLVRPVLIFGAMQGKRITAMLRTLAELRPRMVFTRASSGAVMPPERLGATWRRVGGGRAVVAPDARTAVERARELAAGSPVVVCGSLYLVGEVRGMLAGESGGQATVTDR